MQKPPVVAPLSFPLDPNTLTALRKGGFIVYGTATIGGGGTVTIATKQIKASSTPLVSAMSNTSGAALYASCVDGQLTISGPAAALAAYLVII